jgi:peptidoglycan/xylan/chitin deacetylase (PgdA/CDA1 family)
VIRYALAPVVPSIAAALGIPRTLSQPGTADADAGARPGVALTFDDGPHPDGTPAILEILNRADATATFFLIGEQVDRRPALAREIADRGHAIALHGHWHRAMLRLSRAQIEDDLQRGTDAIQRATGQTPTLHRPPYGLYSREGLAAVHAAALAPLLWSKWGKDWRKFTTPARIASRATRNLGPGDVILLHDADFYSAKRSHERTTKALPAIISELERGGHATVLPV